MNTVLRATAARMVALLLAFALLLSTSGCLPLLLFGATENLRQDSTSLQEVSFEPEGIYNDLTYEELCAVLFEHEATSDNLTLNQLVSDPEALALEVPRPASFGEFSYEATLEDNQFYAEILEALTGSHTINTATLSSAQKLESEYIEKTLSKELQYQEFFYYSEPLSPSTGVQASLPLNLIDYSLRSTEDIDVYLELLLDTPRMFDELLVFEQEKKDKQLLMPLESIEASIEEAEAYVGDAETHLLVTAFNEMLDEAVAKAVETSTQDQGQGESQSSNQSKVQAQSLASLTKEQIQEYKQRNVEYVESAVVPAYETLIAGLESLVPSCREGTRLYDYVRGADYYELEMESMGFVEGPTSAAATLDATIEKYSSLLANEAFYVSDASSIPESVIELIGTTPEEYIAYVQQHSAAEFAPAGTLSYEVKVAPEASPNDYAMAYFMIPPVDNPQQNTIVFFPRNIADKVELFSTMAHEGYPGHMYQFYAYSVENPSNISKVLGSLAYIEGWAMYAESRAMTYLDADPLAIEYFVAYERFIYALHARVDIGVNFEGWSVADTKDYLATLGYEAAAEDLYEVSIKQPVAYLPYGLGVIEFDNLRSLAEAELGQSFNASEFHQKITSLGPVSFDMLEREIEAWLRASNAQKI